MKYQYLTVGGTFDRLHKGHRKLLDHAFDTGETIWLGITSDEFVKQYKNQNHLPSQTQPFVIRQQSVEKYLGKRLDRTKIVAINDQYGTTLTDPSLQAIVVSPETRIIADEINQKRIISGWLPLKIVQIPWVLASDGKPINSLRVRSGEIDREGEIFNLDETWGVRRLPDNLRQTLKQPIGELFSDAYPMPDLLKKYSGQLLHPFLITVGDVATIKFLKFGITPDISIVDLHIQRKRVYENVLSLGFRRINVLKKAKNTAGTLSYESYLALDRLIRYEPRPSILQIDGEEDLLALFAIFLSPLDSLIVYGQPNQGLVVIQVTEKVKEQSRKWLKQFV